MATEQQDEMKRLLERKENIEKLLVKSEIDLSHAKQDVKTFRLRLRETMIDIENAAIAKYIAVDKTNR